MSCIRTHFFFDRLDRKSDFTKIPMNFVNYHCVFSFPADCFHCFHMNKTQLVLRQNSNKARRILFFVLFCHYLLLKLVRCSPFQPLQFFAGKDFFQWPYSRQKKGSWLLICVKVIRFISWMNDHNDQYSRCPYGAPNFKIYRNIVRENKDRTMEGMHRCHVHIVNVFLLKYIVLFFSLYYTHVHLQLSPVRSVFCIFVCFLFFSIQAAIVLFPHIVKLFFLSPWSWPKL